MNTDKQIDKLHDDLREILDPDGFGWINKSTEVVIDDLIMGGVEKIEKCKNHPSENIEKCEIIRDLQMRFALHFGTYTNKDTVKVADVVRLINRIVEELLEGK